VNFKEMVYALRTNPQQATLQGIMRPVRFVSPQESAADLLKAFVDQHAHMAIVRDDSQCALGLVTLEDLVEELVGELEDEFDRLPRMLHALAGRLWMVGGGTRVGDVNQKLGLSLPEPDQTVSRWLSSRLASSPRPGQVHREQGWTFNVRRVRRGRVFEVSLQPDAAHAGN
jgi:putative hemolysin